MKLLNNVIKESIYYESCINKVIPIADISDISDISIYLYIDIQSKLIDAGNGFPLMFMDRTLYKVFFHMHNTLAVF